MELEAELELGGKPKLGEEEPADEMEHVLGLELGLEHSESAGDHLSVAVALPAEP